MLEKVKFFRPHFTDRAMQNSVTCSNAFTTAHEKLAR